MQNTQQRLREKVETPAALTNASDTEMSLPTVANAFERRLVGGYELLNEIASGGMGVVYLARQIKADRIVALKLIRSRIADRKEFERFQAEVKTAAKLDHPNIVPVYDVGEFNGEPFFTMKLVEGGTLAQKLARSPLASREAAELVRTVAGAIHFAHERKVIHRDLKPGNILLDINGEPLITDFGLAKVADNQSDLTKEGQAVGTPSYMPPEQAMGKRDSVNARSDVYAIGAVLYTCLTGRPPFQAASTMGTIMQLLTKDVVPPAQLNNEVNKDLETICLKCLEKDAVRRYDSALDLANDLGRYLSGQPILARPASAGERLWKWVLRHPALASLACLSVALMVAISIAVASAAYNSQLQRSLEETKLAKAESDAANLRAEKTTYRNSMTLANQFWNEGKLTQVNALLRLTDRAFRGWEYGLLDSLMNQQIAKATLPSPVDILTTAKDGSIVSVNFYSDTPVHWHRADDLASVAKLEIGRIGFAAISGDGDRVVVDRQGKIELYSAHIAMPSHVWSDLDGETYALAIDAEGKRIARMVAPNSDRGTIEVFDGDDGQCLQKLELDWAPRAMAFTHAANRLVVAGKDLASIGAYIAVWDTTNWLPIHSQRIEGLPVDRRFLSISGDDRWCCVFQWDRSLRVFSLDDLTKRSAIAMAEDEPLSSSLSATGDLMLTGHQNGIVRLWDVATRKPLQQYPGHTRRCRAVLIAKDEKHFYSGSEDLTVRKWKRWKDGPIRKRWLAENEYVNSIAFTPDGSAFATAGRGGTKTPPRICIWPDKAKEPIDLLPSDRDQATHMANILFIQFLNKEELLSVGGDKTIRVWNTERMQQNYLVPLNPVPASQGGDYIRAAVDQSGRFVAVIQGKQIEIVDLEQRKSIKTLRAESRHWIKDLCFCPTRNELALAADRIDGGAQIESYNLQTHEHRILFDKKYQGPSSIVYSPNGKLIVYGDSIGQLFCLNAISGEKQWGHSLHSQSILSLAWSPDGERLAVGTNDGTIGIWDAQGGELVLMLHEANANGTSLVFKPSGDTLMTTGNDSSVIAWVSN